MKTFFCFIYFLIFATVTFAQEKTTIFDVARKGTVAQAKELLKSDTKVFDLKSPEGFSPLILACYRGNNEVAKFMIESGCKINENSNMGTPLMAAVVKGNNEIAKLLIEKKADVNLSDANGTTALIYATMFKNYEIVELLIKQKANPDFKDNRGNSAVDYAILADDDKLIQILKTK